LREKEDAPYRRLRRVLRHPWAIRAYRWLHPDFATRVALRSSHTSRNMRPRDGGEGLRRVAHARLHASDAPQLLVFGHSHVPTLERIGRGVFANPGAWLDAPRMLRITPDEVALTRWDGRSLVPEQSLALQA
jgi:UDP-2,3-diacylglucosamine hydrolase